MAFIPQTCLWATAALMGTRRANNANAIRLEVKRQLELKEKRENELKEFRAKEEQRQKEIRDKIIELVGDQNAHCVSCGEYYTSYIGYSHSASDVSQPKIRCYCGQCQHETNVRAHRKTAYSYDVTLSYIHENGNSELKSIRVIAFTESDAIDLALAYEDNAKNGWILGCCSGKYSPK